MSTHPSKKLSNLQIVESFGGGVYSFIKSLVNSDLSEIFNFTILYGNRDKIPDEQIKKDFPTCELIPWKHAKREIHPLHDSRALIQALRVMRRAQPSIVHCHSSKAGVLGRMGAKLSGLNDRVFYSPHGLSFLKLDDPKWKRGFYQMIEKTMDRLGGTVVGCSRSESDALRSIKVKSVCIENGVEIFSPAPERGKGMPIRVVTVGRVTAQKNPALFNKVAMNFPDIVFTWIGEGELRDQLSSNNVKVTGWLPREKVRELLFQSDLYLSTSLWEGLPISVLEAMVAGLPLMLKNCTGNVDLVRGENGALFDSYEEAINLMQGYSRQPEQLVRMGINSRKVVEENFSIQKMLENYRNAYLDVYQNNSKERKSRRFLNLKILGRNRQKDPRTTH